MRDESQIVIKWDRENGQAKYDLTGMSHVEAQRLLQIVLQANLEHALAEAQGLHRHDPLPSPPPERGREENKE